MDFVYLGVITAFAVLTVGLVTACRKLENLK